MTGAQKISIGMRTIYAILWLIYLCILATLVPSLLTVLGIAFATFILAYFAGMVIFSRMKGEVNELAQMTEGIVVSASSQIAELERQIISLGGAVLSKDEPAIQ